MPRAPLPPSLRCLLRDPAAAPRPTPAEHATALLRAHLLPRIARALAAEGQGALLVKGAALALTVYPDAAARPMTDIDLLVPRARRDATVAALVRSGGVEHSPPGRPWSAALLGETGITLRAGAMSLLVEVHTSLDKIVPRPVDERALFARATPAPLLPGLSVPSPEDHALLVALHASGHDFDHPIALLDLELLFRRGLDFRALTARAKAWRLGTVMFILLGALRELGAASITDAHVAAFDPGFARRALIERRRRAGIETATPELGLPWMFWQTPLRDDLGAWALGVLRYAAVRGVERLLFPQDKVARRDDRSRSDFSFRPPSSP
jgi:hypothetical protein